MDFNTARERRNWDSPKTLYYNQRIAFLYFKDEGKLDVYKAAEKSVEWKSLKIHERKKRIIG